jgi:hypothetical protein
VLQRVEGPGAKKVTAFLEKLRTIGAMQREDSKINRYPTVRNTTGEN